MKIFALDLCPPGWRTYNCCNAFAMGSYLLNRKEASVDKVIEFKEIAGRIATNGKFCKNHKVCS